MKKRWLSSLPIHSLVTQPLFPSSFICCTFLFLLLRSDSRVDRNPSVLRIHQNVPGIVIKIWHGKVSGLEVYLMDEARSRLFSFPFLTYITPPRYLAVKTKERTRYKFSPHHPSLCIWCQHVGDGKEIERPEGADSWCTFPRSYLHSNTNRLMKWVMNERRGDT